MKVNSTKTFPEGPGWGLGNRQILQALLPQGINGNPPSDLGGAGMGCSNPKYNIYYGHETHGNATGERGAVGQGDAAQFMHRNQNAAPV